ncbi:hypothetical protein M378DRAFT_169158 [Amanita muscaria Koide BX008]|uniref:Uncharacterized protein n=1 Tax=Amanita muscaria (strain Koide BX008) TaxID=946122 RepID=A0A0C2WT71_AMAMK|nr:hypothetical protein M378DRAFT_169158 [Amanita muscaria Koide BX008]
MGVIARSARSAASSLSLTVLVAQYDAPYYGSVHIPRGAECWATSAQHKPSSGIWTRELTESAT